jgi:hypothetical protein
MLTSPEYASIVIISPYKKYLELRSGPGAVDGGIPLFQKESLQNVIKDFLVSDEYRQRS